MVLEPIGCKIRRSQNISVNEESSLSQNVSIEVTSVLGPKSILIYQ